MFSYSYLETFALFLGALTVSYCTYEEILKRLTNRPVKTAVKPHVKHQIMPSSITAQPAIKKVINQRFEVEIKDSKVVHELTSENFKELLSPYFIAVDYLLELWTLHKFNLIITDRIQEHYGKEKTINGFIRFRQIPEIYIKASTTSKHRTGILIHELSHLLSYKEAIQKNIRTTSHGPLFKKHLRLLFKPLLVDKTYYKKHHELSYHLTYEARKYSPAKDLCY
jgi:hypothetical protein